jgi:DNA-binding SARP family transcriptional activator/tetratricopeptide (TPR) repeat protein
MYQLLLLGEPVLLDASGDAVPVWRPAMALVSLAASAADACVARERAAGLLWPALDEPKARRALRQVLFRVRHDVGELLAGDRTTIGLNRRCVAADIIDFDRALAAGDTAAAADLYRGDFLAGFSLPGSAAFDHWADGRRELLRTRAVEALDTMVDAATAAGDWREALHCSQRRLDIDPFSERAAARLVELHHQSGDRARALALHDSLAMRFAARLGAPPGGELAVVGQRIRRARTPSPAAPPARAGPASPRVTTAAFQLPLVGRAAEFAALMERWTLACGGARQVVVIGGEEGVGKTRLADEFRRWVATRGATTLWTRAYEIERQIPYATLAGALREALHAPGLAGIDEHTAVELGRIVPEFLTRFAGMEPAPPSSGIDAGRLRVLEAVRDVVDSLAYEAPVLVVLDDVQWADEASLAALNYICRILPHSPLLLLLTARTAELAPADVAMQLIHGLVREADEPLCRIVLPPLDAAAIRSALVGLAQVETDLDEAASMLLRETGGNALFMTELLQAGAIEEWRARLGEHRADHAATGTHEVRASHEHGARDRLSALAADRLMRLPEPARRLLEAAAVLGRQFPLRLAAMLASLDTAGAADAMNVLLRRGLLRQVEYGYDFGHGLLRREVLARVGPTRLAELHAAAFKQLEPAAATESAGIGVERANALAHHAACAGLHAEAHRWYLHAADRAMRLYAGAEAEAALHGALEHAVDTDANRVTQVQLAQLAWARSDYAGAARAYRRAVQLCADPVERLCLRIRMLDAGLRGGILGVADADALAPQLLDEAAAAGLAPLRDICMTLAEAWAAAGRRPEAVSCAQRAVDAARAAGERQPTVAALLLLARLAVEPGETERPLACLQDALAVARTHQLERERLDVQIELGTELSRIGRWDDAIAAFRIALTDAGRTGEPGAEIVAAINLSDLLVRRGDWTEAEAVLAAGGRIAGRYEFPHADAAIRLNRALLKWLRGDDVRSVVATAQDAAARATEAGLRAVERAACALLVLSRLDDGDTAGAVADAERMETVARASHANWAGDQELAVLAATRLARIMGGADASSDGLETALATAVSACGRALLRLELAHETGTHDPAGAAVLRAEALDTLEQLGAAPLVSRLEHRRHVAERGSHTSE